MNSRATDIWKVMNNAFRTYMQNYPFFTEEIAAFTASITI